MFFHWNTFHAHNLPLLKITTYIIYQLGLYILGSRIIGYKSIIILSRPSAHGFLLCSVLIHFSFSIFSALIIHFGERKLNEFGQIRLYLLFPFWSSTSELLQKIELKILFGHTNACVYESASIFMYKWCRIYNFNSEIASK